MSRKDATSAKSAGRDQNSVDSGFASGTHAHATGTGKSVIGLNIISSFFEANPLATVIWLCEQASVIKDIFQATRIKDCCLIDLVNLSPPIGASICGQCRSGREYTDYR